MIYIATFCIIFFIKYVVEQKVNDFFSYIYLASVHLSKFFYLFKHLIRVGFSKYILLSSASRDDLRVYI